MMRKYKFFAVFLLVLAFLPLPAYAFDAWPNGTYWTGITTPAHYGAFVRADDIYGAAVYGLNKDPATISVEDRLKLSDPDYGGRFYVYAQTFFNVDGWPNMPEWLPAYVMAATVGLAQSFERVYASEVSTTLRDEALRDLERVLAGEDLGGGGSGGGSIVVGDYFQVDLRSWGNTNTIPHTTITATNATINSDGLLIVGTGTRTVSSYPSSSNYVANASVYLSRSVVEFANNLISQGYKVGFSHSGSLVYASDLTVLYGINPSNLSESCYYYYSPSGSIRFYNSEHSSFYYDGTLFCFANAIIGNPSSWGNNIAVQYLCDPISTPIVAPPSGDWPEPSTPVTPDPPEQPTPTAPTVTPDNDPTEPVVTWPTSPTVVLPTQPTPSTTPSGLDYTGLLTLINDNLISIDDYLQALNSSFNSFRSDFLTAVDSIVDSIRNIYSYLGHLNDILEVHCKHIRDQIEDSVYNLELYIKDLFEWLPRQLDYDAEFSYDDTYVTNLLYRILNKIPGGSAGTPVTYQPNPQADEPGFFDWLLDLWHRFLIDLVSVLPDELGGLVDAFSQLTHYFPFSIPWDLAALLALFEHEPVTPVFDVPWGFGGDEGEIQMVRVDLHVWDDVMEMVRPVFVAGFCIQLALITKELLGNFDIHRGGV